MLDPQVYQALALPYGGWGVPGVRDRAISRRDSD
jgi:hypothetical protein